MKQNSRNSPSKISSLRNINPRAFIQCGTKVCIHVRESVFEPCREKTGFLRMRKQGADQLRGNREADRRLCFASKIEQSKPLANLCGCTAWFVWDLVRNPEYRFSHNEAHLFQPIVSATTCSLLHNIYL